MIDDRDGGPLVPATDSPLDAALAALDELLEQGADLETVVVRSAELLGCAAGVRGMGGMAFAAGPGGACDPHGPPEGARCRRLPDGVEVWLAPAEGTLLPESAPAVAAVLRRFGVAVKVGLLYTATHGRAADLRAVVDPRAADADRVLALARLGLRGAPSVTLLAVAGPSAGIGVLVDRIRARASLVHHGLDDRVHLVITPDFAGLDDLAVPVGVRCAWLGGTAPLEAPEAWRRTRNALRFALPSTHDSAPYALSESTVVAARHVGAYAILAEQLTADELARVEDVQRLEQLCRESGADMLETLLAVAATDSLRKAAATVHMHHNSVAHRVRRAEKVLGFRCTEPYGRARLLLVLTLHRLLESRKHF